MSSSESSIEKNKSSSSHLVAAIQMVSLASVEDNLKQAGELLEQAANQGARLALLPENFALMKTSMLHTAGVLERETNGPIRSFLRERAQSLGLWIIAGSVPISARPDGTELAQRIRQSCLVINDRGEEVARYDKIHLFDVDVDDGHQRYRESDSIEPGKSILCVDTPAGRVGLSICYDLRFPELYRQLMQQGAEILVVPAAFTVKTGAAHWHALLRARAIENLCYVIGAGQAGQHSKTRYTYGHSLLVDPWGEIVSELETGSGVLVAPIDLGRQQRLRAQMPVDQHLRLL